MGKFVAFLFIIFLAILGYLAHLNRDTVTLKLGEKYIYEIPEIALIFFSIVLGAFAVLAIGVIRDTRRYIENLQNQRQQKKSLKIQESYAKGLDAFFASRYEEAGELFNRVIEEDTNNINALLRLGDIAFNKEDLVKARDYYSKAKDLRPKSVEALFSLEKVFESERRWQEALRYLDNILEIDDENPKALFRKREIYEINRNWEALLDVQHKIIKSDIPENEKEKEQKNLFGYKYELGRHYLEKEDLDKAIKVLKNVIKLDKDFITAYLALAESYVRDGDAEAAENILLKGYEATSALVFLVRLEDFFISVGEPGRIIDIYKKEIQNNLKDHKLQFFLAKLYYRLEMIDYAYETVTGIDTSTLDYPDLHVLIGFIHERRMQYDKAAEEFKKALNSEKPLLIPYCCSECNHPSNEWTGRCIKCKQWNTLTLDLNGTCKI